VGAFFLSYRPRRRGAMGIEGASRQRFARLRTGVAAAHIRAPAPHPFAEPVDYYEPSAKTWDDDLKDIRFRLMGAGILLLAVTIIGTVGFKIIDPSAGWVRAFFMTAITLTTVGYGHEVAVDTDGARIFTAALILVGMGGVVYFVSTGTAFILEGQLGHVFRRRRMQRDLSALTSHIIVCGAGPSARYAAAELSSVERAVVLVAPEQEDADRAKAELSGVYIVLGNPTDEATLMAAGIERAAGLVACTDSDNENVVVTLTARQINPKVRIVSRLEDVDHEKKIRKVGANSVVSPDFIGGLRMASELIRPTVVTFLDTMLRDRDLNLRIDEILIPASSAAVGKALNELGLGNVPEILLLAVRTPDGQWQYNPPRTRVVTAGVVLIFLGSPKDSRALCDQLGGEMIGAAQTV
jgi:voltage-gated potassium channel